MLFGVALIATPVLQDVPLRAKTLKRYDVLFTKPVMVTEEPVSLYTTYSLFPKSVPKPNAGFAVYAEPSLVGIAVIDEFSVAMTNSSSKQVSFVQLKLIKVLSLTEVNEVTSVGVVHKVVLVVLNPVE